MENRLLVKTEENVKCQIITKQFTLNNTEKEKTFQCENCNAGFVEKNALSAHFEDVQKNPLQCSICHAVFTRRGSLKNHKVTVHEGNKPYQCATCKRCFVTKVCDK